MSYYTDQRDEIKAQLEAVSGIGNVFTKRNNPESEKEFKNAYVKNNVVNSVFISRVEGSDRLEDDPLGSVSEKNEIVATGKRDYWEITFIYGYNDTTPSEDTFQGLIDLIEEKFRMLEDLNNKAYFSYPLQRVQSGLFQFHGHIFCHKAVWKLQVVNRVQ